jgi:hypothetical protein
MLSKFRAICGEAAKVFVEIDASLVPPAQVVLGSDQPQGHTSVTYQFRVVGEVVFYPSG